MVSLLWHLWHYGVQKACFDAEPSTPHNHNDPNGIRAESLSPLLLVLQGLSEWIFKLINLAVFYGYLFFLILLLIHVQNFSTCFSTRLIQVEKKIISGHLGCQQKHYKFFLTSVYEIFSIQINSVVDYDWEHTLNAKDDL